MKPSVGVIHELPLPMFQRWQFDESYTLDIDRQSYLCRCGNFQLDRLAGAKNVPESSLASSAKVSMLGTSGW